MLYGRFQLLRGNRAAINSSIAEKITTQGVAFNLDTDTLIFYWENKLCEICGESVGSPPPGAMQGEVFQDMGSPGPQRTLICGTGKMLRFEGVLFVSGAKSTVFVPNDGAVYNEYTPSA